MRRKAFGNIVPGAAAFIVAVLGVGLVTGPAWAVNDYEACLTLIEQDPQKALTEAGTWARYGNGGTPARHCYALALLASGAPLSAADELMAAATEEQGLTDNERSRLFVQAGEILLDAGEDLSPAIAAEQAVKLSPNSADAIGLRGAVKLKADDYTGALNDLNRSIKLGGPQANYLTLRASAKRRLGRATAARDDAVWATEIDPASAHAWLERGRAEAAVQDRHNARQSFLKVMDLARGSNIARAAQLALQAMDTGADG